MSHSVLCLKKRLLFNYIFPQFHIYNGSEHSVSFCVLLPLRVPRQRTLLKQEGGLKKYLFRSSLVHVFVHQKHEHICLTRTKKGNVGGSACFTNWRVLQHETLLLMWRGDDSFETVTPRLLAAPILTLLKFLFRTVRNKTRPPLQQSPTVPIFSPNQELISVQHEGTANGEHS